MSTSSTSARVAFQGERGAYSEAAAREMFAIAGERQAPRLTVDAIPCASFDDVFTTLISGKVEYAAVPIENTLGGSIHANYDLLLRHHGAVHIVGEHSFRVRHALLVTKGTPKSAIKRVMSHPQALAQCDGFIRRNGWERVPAYDTAGSAKMIAEQKLHDAAAICSASAAELFGLEVLENGIEDDTNNFTRFLLLHCQPLLPPSEAPCKTTVVFQPSTNEAGILFKALSVFALREIDLCKIESRPGRRVSVSPSADGPVAKRPRSGNSASEAAASAQFEYTFYIDLLAHSSDQKSQDMGTVF
ncbi:Prephenate dehydratase-domain-containing protein [Pavlovales sp. CCMP2436]|nr:Prephenate dehydratase-domain-containing protein [Pavlovales sp. CCMP2436]